MWYLLALIAVVAAEECSNICHANWDPVCGSDGQTYGNTCELTNLACQRRSNVIRLYKGECTPMKLSKFTGCQMRCTREYNPVCGTDGLTYGNECELTSRACLKRNNVAVSFAGECQDQCQTMCNLDYNPVCGSDGVTYGNMCEMTSTACLKRNAVTMAYDGEC